MDLKKKHTGDISLTITVLGILLVLFLISAFPLLWYDKGLVNQFFGLIEVTGISHQTILFIMLGMAILILVILLLAICITMWRFVRKKRLDHYKKLIDSDLSIMYLSSINSIAYQTAASNIMKRASILDRLDMLEEYLLDIILRQNKKKATVARELADYAKLTVRCVERINSTNNKHVIAQNCRKAGLYGYTNAIPVMMSMLSIRNWEIQYEVIKSFALMGNIEAMIQGLDKVAEYKLLSKQKIIDILKSFRGNKLELYQTLLHHPNETLVYSSLKSLNVVEIRALSGNILLLLDNSLANLRIASAEALASLRDEKYTHDLLKGFQDSTWEMRAATANIFGNIVCADAEKYLIEMIDAPHWWIRQIAIDSILKYQDYQSALAKVLNKRDDYAPGSACINFENEVNFGLLDKSKAVWVKKQMVT